VKKYIHSFGRKTRKKETLRRPQHRWEDNMKTVSKKQDVRMWTGFIWLL
jgi:hypothetical protein